MFFYVDFVRAMFFHAFLHGRKHFSKQIAQRLIVWPIFFSDRVVSCVSLEGRFESLSVLFFIVLVFVASFFYRHN